MWKCNRLDIYGIMDQLAEVISAHVWGSCVGVRDGGYVPRVSLIFRVEGEAWKG